MLKSILSGIAVITLVMTTMQSSAFAGKGHRGGFDVLDFIEIDDDDDEDGLSCAFIKRQARKVGSAYWKNRYRDECLDD